MSMLFPMYWTSRDFFGAGRRCRRKSDWHEIARRRRECRRSSLIYMALEFKRRVPRVRKSESAQLLPL